MHRILWIDGLGGFLLCVDFPLAIGNASAQPSAGIPIQADLGRKHALIHRDREGFAIERGDGLVEIQGKSVSRMFLEDRTRIQLAGRCELEFRQAIAGSDTARIDIARGGRLPFPVRSVLLVGQALTLAADSRRGDLAVPGLEGIVSLIRTKDGFELRSAGSANGTQQRETIVPGRPAFVHDLCLTLEEVAG